MDGQALKPRLPGRGLPDVRSLGLLALGVVWSIAAAAAVAGRLTVPYASYALLLVPIGLGAVILFGRRPASDALRRTTLWTGVLAGAIVAGAMVDALPLVALAVPALLISALAVSRRPALGVVGVFLFTGTHGTLTAHTPLPVGESIDVVLAGLWLGAIWGYLVSSRERPILFWPGMALVTLYLGLTATEILFAESLWIGLEAFRASAWYMLVVLLIAYAGWRPSVHEWIARGVALAAAVVGAYAVFRWIVGPSGKEEALALANSLAGYNFVNGDLRLFGSLTSGVELGAWTAAAIPACCAYALTFHGRWRIVAAVAAGLCSFAMLGSEARIALFAAVAGVGVVLVLYQLARGFPGLHLGVTAGAVIGVIGLGAALYPVTVGRSDASADRYVSAIQDPTNDPSYAAREFKWRTALEEIDDRPLGHGLGTAGRTEAKYGRFRTVASLDLDSSYLKLAYEQGLAVMVFFVLAVGAFLVGLARRAVLADSALKAGIGIAACGTLVSFLVLLSAAQYIEGLSALAAWIIVGLGAAQFATGGAQRA